MYIKKYIFLAASALALASCTSDDFMGDTPGNVESNNVTISFGGSTGKISRATATQSGATAAATLGNNFIVYGTKTKDNKTNEIYNYYNVNWKTAAEAGTSSESWVYAGEAKTSLNNGGNQSLKYWDYAATGYDFVAFSLGGKSIGTGDDEISVSRITNHSKPTYTLTGKVSNLQKCYIADRIALTTGYESPVKFTFRSTGTKVSIAIYENISGYSIKSIKFYDSSTSTTPSNTPILYANSEQILSDDSKGKLSVSFDENNTAHAVLTEETQTTTTKASKISFTTFTLNTTKEDHETTDDTEKYLSRTSSDPTTSSTEAVLPCTITGGLHMKVDYTLIATDGSGEEIEVKGATVDVPQDHTQWKANFHYTYKFKITENTNGSTGGSVTGLHPITFDAIITEDLAGSQTTETEFKTDGTGSTTKQ